MKTIPLEKIKRFRTRLLKENISFLMRKGDRSLNPIAACQPDPEGRITIPTDKIIDFFFDSINLDESPTAREHFSNLHTLFETFSKDIEEYSFESESRISEKDIQEANTQTTIEYLTKNLIISYFDHIRSEESGQIDHSLLDEKLAKLIRISSSGRDYRRLVENTLQELVETLKNEDSWHKCIRNMNDAALACNLVGSTLPKIDQAVVAKFIQQARDEIAHYNQLFSKILNTREMMVQNEPNLKTYLKSVAKLNLAIEQTLAKLDTYFSFAHNFTELLDLPLDKFIGKENDSLLENLAKFFLGYASKQDDEETAVPDIHYSEIRFRIDKLFAYPHLLTYCKAFKDHERYSVYYLHIFKLYYDELALMLEQMSEQPEKAKADRFAGCVYRLERMMKEITIEPDLLIEEKQRVHQNFTSLIHLLTIDQLNDFMPIRDHLRTVTHDLDGELLESSRKILVKACFEALGSLDRKEMKQEDFQTIFQKTLFGYAVHYRPQRVFYMLLFETYIGKPGEAPASTLQQGMKSDKGFVLMVLKMLSDPVIMEQLLPQSYREYAEELLDDFKNTLNR